MGSLIFKGAWAHGMPWDLGPFVHGCKGSWAHWLKAARFQWEGDATMGCNGRQWDATANPPIWDHASHSLDGRQREAMGGNGKQRRHRFGIYPNWAGCHGRQWEAIPGPPVLGYALTGSLKYL